MTSLDRAFIKAYDRSPLAHGDSPADRALADDVVGRRNTVPPPAAAPRHGVRPPHFILRQRSTGPRPRVEDLDVPDEILRVDPVHVEHVAEGRAIGPENVAASCAAAPPVAAHPAAASAAVDQASTDHVCRCTAERAFVPIGELRLVARPPAPRPARTAAPPLPRPAVVAPPECAAAPASAAEWKWPTLCERLDRAAGAELDRLADGVAGLMGGKAKIVGFTGCRRGEGATLLLLAAARRLAERGRKTLVVDADWDDARLARSVGIAAAVGLNDVLTGRCALPAVIVPAGRNAPAMLPLAAAVPLWEALTARAREALATAAESFDHVLVNLGPADDVRLSRGGPGGLAAELDAIVLVHDVRSTTPERLGDVCQKLAAFPVEVALVENYTRAGAKV